MNARSLLLSLVLLSTLACDNSARNEQIASVEKKVDAPGEDETKKRAEKRLAAERAKSDAAEAIRVEIVKVAVLGEKPPKGLAEGCEAAADAQDRFVARLRSAEAQAAWTAARERERPMAIIACTSADSLDVASCQINALDKAPPALADHMQEVLDFCISKFARPRPGAAAASSGEIPKRPK